MTLRVVLSVSVYDILMRDWYQIAQALVISERTAAVHVEHILSKLNLHSRWQVAEAVAALGPPAPPS